MAGKRARTKLAGSRAAESKSKQRTPRVRVASVRGCGRAALLHGTALRAAFLAGLDIHGN